MRHAIMEAETIEGGNATKIPSAPLETWRSLYENSLRFLELRPWESLQDSDIFGVLHPGTGRTGYCCVLGALGQVLALCVYLGSEGIEIYRRMEEEEFTLDYDELAAAQFCLTGEFEDRSALKKQDLAVIKALGLKFRGRRAYPVFRSYLPGYGPWFLTEEEAIFLTLAFGTAWEAFGLGWFLCYNSATTERTGEPI